MSSADFNFPARLRTALDLRRMTQTELARAAGLSKSSISRYLSGAWKGKQDAVHALAEALDVSESWLLGYDVPMERLRFTVHPGPLPEATAPRPTDRLPLLRTTVQGENFLDSQNIEAYLTAPAGVRCDCLLRCSDDSMIGAGMQKGDTVFLRLQNTVEDGAIAAVRIGHTIVLRYVYRTAQGLTLAAANSAYSPEFLADDAVHMVGKAVGYLHLF